MARLDESLLGHLPPFARLSGREIREILDRATSRRYDKNESVFDEGAEATRFHLLLDGTVRVVHMTTGGESVTVLHIPSGQLFGFAIAIGKTVYPATAIAAAESVVLSWPMRLWPEFARMYDGFALETHKIIGDRLSEMNTRIVDAATLQVEQRVARAVLRLIGQTGRKTDDGIEIGFPITRQDISDMTGTTLHTVSRLLSAWERDGIVKSERKRVVVLAPHRLVTLSEALPPE